MKKELLNTDVVLMVGLPASGKSSLVTQYQNDGYVVISLDNKTMSSSTDTKPLKKELEKGNKVVIDNTNFDFNVRKEFISLTVSLGSTIGIHWLNTSKEDCLINSLHRMYNKHGQIFMHQTDATEAGVKGSNDFVLSAIFAMFKKFDKPSKDDGVEILKSKFERIDSFEYTNKALFIDLDETVRRSTGEQMYPLKKEDISILENSESVLKDYKAKGYKIIAVTNQSGISKGLLTKVGVVDLINETNDLLGGVIDDYHYCPHLPPKEICYCRKPQSGAGVLMQHKHGLDLSSSIMVGDSTSDKTFAKRLGMEFYHPDEFFNRKI